MDISITPRENRNKIKINYMLEWGKEPGQRQATGTYTYAKPKDQLQKNHNKEAFSILAGKKSQMVLDLQAMADGSLRVHRLKKNFLDFYQEIVNIIPGLILISRIF